MKRKDTEFINLLENVFTRLSQAHVLLFRRKEFTDIETTAFASNRMQEINSLLRSIKVLVEELEEQLQEKEE